MSEERGPWEVIALWEDFPPEVFEEWPTEREAVHSAILNERCRESEYVTYYVRPKLTEEGVAHPPPSPVRGRGWEVGSVTTI
jgi:hypothetical protein